MADLVRILLLVPLAYIGAVIAAAVIVAMNTARVDIGVGPGDVPLFAGLMIPFVGAASFLPALVAIAVAEAFAIRSVFYFLILGGGIGLVMHLLTPFFGPAELLEQRAISFPAAGFAAGFVYWLIAGRRSGFGRGGQKARSA